MQPLGTASERDCVNRSCRVVIIGTAVAAVGRKVPDDGKREGRLLIGRTVGFITGVFVGFTEGLNDGRGDGMIVGKMLGFDDTDVVIDDLGEPVVIFNGNNEGFSDGEALVDLEDIGAEVGVQVLLF